MAQMAFYYGQLNFNHQITNESRSTDVGGTTKTKNTIQQYIDTQESVFEEAESQWYFGVTDEINNVIYGQFGKEYDYERNTYENGEFAATGEEETDAAFSWFIFDPETNILAFNQRNRIGYNQFRNAFVEGYNQRAQEEEDVRNAMNMNWLTTEDELVRIINSNRVTSLEFEIRPMNEANSGYSSLNEILQDSDAEQGAILLKEASEDGLDISEETIQELIDLVVEGDEGFNAKVEYIESGHDEEFSTKIAPATKKVSRPDDLEQLTAVSNQLLRRGRNIIDYSDTSSD